MQDYSSPRRQAGVQAGAHASPVRSLDSGLRRNDAIKKAAFGLVPTRKRKEIE
jgi:hypothetical protein